MSWTAGKTAKLMLGSRNTNTALKEAQDKSCRMTDCSCLVPNQYSSECPTTYPLFVRVGSSLAICEAIITA